MAEVQCSRCGNRAPGLEREPLPGELGRHVLAQTCQACWKEWLAAQIILINEHRLSGANPQHVEQLLGQMKTFLSIREE